VTLAVKLGLEAAAQRMSLLVEVALSSVELVTTKVGTQMLFPNIVLIIGLFADVCQRSATLKCNSRQPGDMDLTGFTHMNFGKRLPKESLTQHRSKD
jgi:hypothetical protein